MRKLILKTAVSLDGFLEGPNGSMDWIKVDDHEQWQEVFALLAGVDTVLLGRGMHEGYLSHWRDVLATPAGRPPDEVAYARWADQARHIVFSRTLRDAPNAEVMRDIATDVPRLKREAGKDLMVYGGARFAGALIDQGLVDDYHLAVHPVAVGGGKPLFNALSRPRALKQAAAKVLPSGVVWLSYTA